MIVAVECNASAMSLNLESVVGGSFGVAVGVPAVSAKMIPVPVVRNLGIAVYPVTGDVPRRRKIVMVAVIGMAGKLPIYRDVKRLSIRKRLFSCLIVVLSGRSKQGRVLIVLPRLVANNKTAMFSLVVML